MKYDAHEMLTREHVVWAYRLLLDRDPENEDVIGPKLAGSQDTKELRHHFVTSTEYHQKNPDFAHTNDRTLVIKKLDGGARLVVDLSDHVIGLNIVRGRYESDEVALVRRLLRPGDTALDVGAHIGFFAMQMAALVGAGGRVVAFEPLDRNAELLEQSIAENQFEDRVTFRRAAVGGSSGTATLTYPVETLNSGGAYLLRGGATPLAGNVKQTVPLMALDDLELPRPVRFIKIDVEGAEPQVMNGAKRILREDRPVILSELHRTQLARASGATADDFFAGLREHDYTAHLINSPDDAAAVATADYRDMLGPPLDVAPAAAVVSIVLLPRAIPRTSP
jgi:FkbM family methyltransferase